MSSISGALSGPFFPQFGPLTGFLRQSIASIAQALRRRQTQRALYDLSDPVLKDIGVRRCEIDSVAQSLASGTWDDTRIPRGLNTWL
jgi:uncharacterized protein YjiS (DUF1127 family)